MAILWVPELAVGVAEIDDDHRELIRRVNLLMEALQNSTTATAVAPFLQFLMDHVRRHFDAEERLMRSSHYPGLLAHQAEHSDLEQAVKGLVADYRREGPSARFTMQLAKLLSEGLRDHMAGTDKALGDYLNSSDRSVADSQAARPRRGP